MAAIRITRNMILKEVLSHRLLLPSSSSLSHPPSLRISPLPTLTGATALQFTRREFSFSRIRCAASDDKKVSSRLSQVHQLLHEAEERASAAGNEPTPKITIGEEEGMKQAVDQFVLVHGVSGGGWCWYKIRCMMENSGYKVTCIDLKGSGIDPTDSNSILNFDDYNKPLLDFLSSLPENQQVILVGHSAGGLSVTQACRKFGKKKIKLAVYVAATMLKSGFITDQDILHGVPNMSEYGDDVYDLCFGLGYDKPPTTAIVNKQFQRQLIYQLSPPEDWTLASMLLRPGPIMALQSAKFKDEDEEEEDQEEVERVYIKAKHDKVVKPEQQEAMIEKWPPSQVYSLDSDHSPFFSSPFLLFGLLLKAVASSSSSSSSSI